jgi:hypothetical protein
MIKMSLNSIEYVGDETVVDLLRDNKILEHYGVKGMKWGVRNAETLRKYAGSMGTKMSAVSKFANSEAVRGAVRTLQSKASSMKARAGASYSKARKAHADRAQAASLMRAEKRQARDQEKAERKLEKKEIRNEKRILRKESGLNPIEYEKLRKKTLKSHNPEVIARGMHVLTDAELNRKIDRLNREEVVSKLAGERVKRRNVAITTNPLYKLGEDAVKDLAKNSLHTLGYDTIVMKGVNPILEQRVKYASRKAENKFFARNVGAERSVGAVTQEKAAVDKEVKKIQNRLSSESKANDLMVEATANRYARELSDDRRGRRSSFDYNDAMAKNAENQLYLSRVNAEDYVQRLSNERRLRS